MQEEELYIVDGPSGTKRIRCCRRDDELYTYHVEELRDAMTPGLEGDPDDRYWGEVRYGGLFKTEAAMRRDAGLDRDD
jgi:hypothetical protein